MAATVVLYEYVSTNAGTTNSTNMFGGTIYLHAGGGTATDDYSAAYASHPVVKGASTVYSKERWLRMQVTAPPVTSIVNPQFFVTPASWGTGVTPYGKVVAPASVATPATPSATTGFTAISGWLTGARQSLGTYTVTTATALGDYLVLMVQVQNTASAGTVPAAGETWTWAYDES